MNIAEAADRLAKAVLKQRDRLDQQERLLIGQREAIMLASKELATRDCPHDECPNNRLTDENSRLLNLEICQSCWQAHLLARVLPTVPVLKKVTKPKLQQLPATSKNCSHCHKVFIDLRVPLGVHIDVYCKKCWKLVADERKNYYQDSQVYMKALQWLANKVADQAISTYCFVEVEQRFNCNSRDCNECVYQMALHRAQHDELKGGL